MYVRTSFRGAKTCKIGEKKVCLGHVDKFWKGHDGQIKKKRMQKTHIWGLFSYLKNTCLVCVLKVLLVTRMITSLKYKWPPSSV